MTQTFEHFFVPQTPTVPTAAKPTNETDFFGHKVYSIPVTITTDHAQSSYGQPVVVIDGETYGYYDTVTIAGECIEVKHIVYRYKDLFVPPMPTTHTDVRDVEELYVA